MDNNTPSEFLNLSNIEYFLFEEDFVEENVRCIPMIVRFKMDAAGIKLKLSEWSKFSVEERVSLATTPCNNEIEIQTYHNHLNSLIVKYTGQNGTTLEKDNNPPWGKNQPISQMLSARLQQEGHTFTINQWQSLTNLQRFALLKLCREGHESKNFKKALKEFCLID